MLARRLVRISALAMVGIAVVVLGLAVFSVDQPGIAFARTNNTNQIQQATASTGSLGNTVTMSSTDPMLGMMAQMIGMMQTMVDSATMGNAMPLTNMMPMSGTLPLHRGDMGAMMGMTAQMMSMMNQMHGMMAGDMGAMPGASTLTDTMSLDNDMAEQMIMMGSQMEMMGSMMQMMGRMQRMGVNMPMTSTMAMAHRMFAPDSAQMQPVPPTVADEAAAAESSAAIEESATTKTYELTLAIGAPEEMLTVEEAKTATEGEVMVAGEMGMGTPEQPLTHHLEIFVTDRSSGALITEQPVTITVTDNTTGQVTNIPVAKMYGLDGGVSETHFGNNVTLAAGDYTIVVTIGNEAATFQVTIPAS